MKIIIDTNILMSALIKDSLTREIILKSDFDFYYPELSFGELKKYKDLILMKSNMNEADYRNLLTKLFNKIKIVREDKITNNLEEAKNIMLKIDPNDVVFIAVSLAVKDSIIWSDDRHFQKQSEIKIITTKEMIQEN